jgi:hypothetical protein
MDAFFLSTDNRAIGAGANCWLGSRSGWGNPFWHKDLPPDDMTDIMPGSGGWFSGLRGGTPGV